MKTYKKFDFGDKLEYGMIIEATIQSNRVRVGTMVSVDMKVCKYWESDTDANTYKVYLVCVDDSDKNHTPRQSFYSMDLKQMLRDGISFKLVDTKK